MQHTQAITRTVQVIADITRRMGDGMAKYIQQDVETIAEYDEYCHFVAGLVGVGLSQVPLNACCRMQRGCFAAVVAHSRAEEIVWI